MVEPFATRDGKGIAVAKSLIMENGGMVEVTNLGAMRKFFAGERIAKAVVIRSTSVRGRPHAMVYSLLQYFTK